jgi:hypothetical protein
LAKRAVAPRSMMATMQDLDAFANLSPTTLADVLERDRVMDIGIRPLWPGAPRIAGQAYSVRCPPGDNLMLHAAIYRAPAGSIIVVQAGDCDFAVAGGNVCAVAQNRGIAGFVVDGVIRDLAYGCSRRRPAPDLRGPVVGRNDLPAVRRERSRPHAPGDAREPRLLGEARLQRPREHELRARRAVAALVRVTEVERCVGFVVK